VSRTLSLAEVRRRAVAAQGYATRSRRGRPAEVEQVVERLGAVQLDSISAVERSHRIALASRIGAYPRRTVSLLLANGQLFEYWAHEACLMHVNDWPVYRRFMVDSPDHPWWGSIITSDPPLADRVMGEIRERGPLGSRDFEGAGSGGMWSLKPAKRMLEALWSSGQLVISERRGFQRLYDLPERVLPDDVLGASLPTRDEALRALIVRAVRARGVLTVPGVVEHNRLRGGVTGIRPHVDAVVAEGLLELADVEDGGHPVLVPVGQEPGRTPTAPVLLSPFDNLLWDRPFAQRVLGFEHLIEVYKRPHERRYGYYVLPYLLGDRIVGRVDLRTNRKAGALEVHAVHREARVRWGARHEQGLERALERLAVTAGVDEVRYTGPRTAATA
jgi:uncharacterized protein YcaQ